MDPETERWLNVRKSFRQKKKMDVPPHFNC